MSSIDKILNSQDDNKVILEIGKLITDKLGLNEDLNLLTDTGKIFVYIDTLEREVNNGGFHQFFFNNSGQYSYEALDAYQRIKAFKTADIISKAISLFPLTTIPKDTELRRQIIDTVDNSIVDEWDKLDQEFYKYEDNISKLLIDFIKLNKDLFK